MKDLLLATRRLHKGKVKEGGGGGGEIPAIHFSPAVPQIPSLKKQNKQERAQAAEWPTEWLSGRHADCVPWWVNAVTIEQPG